MGAPLRLIELAEHLPVEGEAVVLKPRWLNPAVEGGGMGIEFRTRLTLGRLIADHREALTRVVFAAGFVAAYCAPDDEEVSGVSAVHVLGANRQETDMIFHTDKVQRVHLSMNAYVGESDVPTGIVSKPVLAKAFDETVRDTAGALHGMKAMHIRRALYEPERNGESALFTDGVSEHLGDLYEALEYVEWDTVRRQTQQHFWDDIRLLNGEPDILWYGMTPERHAGLVQAVFACRNVYHVKGYTALHDQPRSGNKRRIDLFPSDELRARIDARFKPLVFNRPDPVTADWLRGEA